MKKNSVKNLRINEEVQRELAGIIRSEIKDPRIAPIVSVLSVDVTSDLKQCKAYISVLGGDPDETLEGLNSAKGYIRRELARRINLRNTPELIFLMDNSIEYGVSMTSKIDEVISNDRAKSKESTEE